MLAKLFWFCSFNFNTKADSLMHAKLNFALHCIVHNALFNQLPSKSDNYINYQSSPDRVGVSAEDSHARDLWFKPRLWQHLLHRRRFTVFVSLQKNPVASCIGSSLQAL